MEPEGRASPPMVTGQSHWKGRKRGRLPVLAFGVVVLAAFAFAVSAAGAGNGPAGAGNGPAGAKHRAVAAKHSRAAVAVAVKPLSKPVPRPAARRSGLRAAAMMLACGRATIVLTDVQLSRSRVAITVATSLSLAGRKLKIHLVGASAALATVAVPANGLIPLTVSAPAHSSSGNGEYYATVGSRRSANVALLRRLTVNPLRIARGRITISGRVVTPLTRPATNVTVRRRVACGQFVRVARRKPRADGTFAVTLSASTTARAALYTVTTQVPQTVNRHAKATAHGLAQVVTLGNPPVEVTLLSKPFAKAMTGG